MKIALVHKRLDLSGGTERDLYRTAEGLRALGHEIHLFCSEFSVAPPPGVAVHRVPTLPAGRTARLWSFALLAPRSAARERCDLVVSFGRTLRQDVIRSGGGTHRAFLRSLGEEGGPARRCWQAVSVYHRSLLAVERRQFLSSRTGGIIAVSRRVARELTEIYGVASERITVLYNGVDQERFHPSLRARWRRAVRLEWGIPEEAPLALFVGSGFRRKGLDRLIDAWAAPELRRARLLVVGADAGWAAYHRRAERLAPGRIVFTGRQQAVERFYAAADVLAHPALQEAFGNVVLEALASGLPVVVSRAVGASEILAGALADGIVEEPADTTELASKLALMLERSADAALGGEARELAERYSWADHFAKLDACLREVRRRVGAR